MPLAASHTEPSQWGGKRDVHPSLRFEGPPSQGASWVGVFVAAGGRKNHGCFTLREIP